jgi:hypothetical protein
MHRNKKHARRTRRKIRRGGGYEFGGSIMGDASSTGAGNALWSKTVGECGVPRGGKNNVELMGGRRRKLTRRGGSYGSETVPERGGNNVGGRRSRRKQLRRRSSRRSQRGGEYATFESSGGGGSDPRMALQQPTVSYGVNGTGAGGMLNAIQQPPYTTMV